MEYSVKPIGIVRTPYSDWAPNQPVVREAKPGDFRIELDQNLVEGLTELDHFKYITLIAYLHEIDSEPKMKVSPPWAKGKKVGLFASRSPRRINPIALSTVRLIKIEGNVLFIGPVDFFDGTPLLDIKPYIATIDAKADANDGWIEGLDGHRHLLDHMLGIPHEHDPDDIHHSEDSHSHDDDHEHGHSHSAGVKDHLHEHTHSYSHAHGHRHQHEAPEHVHEHSHTYSHAHEHHHHGEKDHDHPHAESDKHDHHQPHEHLHDHEDD